MKTASKSRLALLASLLLSGSLLAAPPANDAFANRLDVTGLSLISGTTVEATKEPGEPNHGLNPGGRSVWYSWTAPATGQVSLLLTNHSFSPLIGVYTGTSVNALTTWSFSANTNTLSFPVIAATTYQLAIDGTSGGSFTLNISPVVTPPPNDFLPIGSP